MSCNPGILRLRLCHSQQEFKQQHVLEAMLFNAPHVLPHPPW